MDLTLPWNQQTWDKPLRGGEICPSADPHGVVQSTAFGVTVSTRVHTSLTAERFRSRLVDGLSSTRWCRGIVSTLSVTASKSSGVLDVDFFILDQWEEPTSVYFDELIIPFFDAVSTVSSTN